MTRLRRISTFESIREELGSTIVSGKYLPGATLPSEAELARQYDASRNTVREALRALGSKGMIETRARTGLQVLPAHRWAWLDPDVLKWRGQSPERHEFTRQVFEIRQMVEPEAVGIAASNITDREIQELQDIFVDWTAHVDDPRRHIELDRDFHAKIFEATHNPMLVQLAHMVVMPGWMRAEEYQEFPRLAAEHAAILKAVCDRDKRAAIKATNTLLAKAKKHYGVA